MSRESDRRAVDTFEWINVVTSIDFDESPELRDAAGKVFKRPAGKSIKNVAWRAAFWGNMDGSRVFLGPARIAVCCEVDYKTAKLILRTLCAFRLLTLVQRGGGVTTPEREGNGGEYRLTIPHDLDSLAKVRSKEEIDAAIDALKEKNRNKGTGQRRPRNSRGADTPVSGVSLGGDTGQPVPRPSESRGNERVSHGAMASAIPTQHQPLKDNQPSSYLPADEANASPSGSPQEEGRDHSEVLKNTHSITAAQLAAPYLAGMRVTERRRITDYITQALERGWTASGIARELAADHAGLANVTAGLISRMRDLGDPPSDDEIGNSGCTYCGGTGLVGGFDQHENPVADTCPACQPLTGERIRAFKAQLAGHPHCPDGVEGGDLPMPGSGWMACATCRMKSGYVSVQERNEQPRTSQRVNPNSIRNSHDNVDRYDVPIGAYPGAGPPSAEVRKARGWLAEGEQAQAAWERSRGGYQPYRNRPDHEYEEWTVGQSEITDR